MKTFKLTNILLLIFIILFTTEVRGAKFMKKAEIKRIKDAWKKAQGSEYKRLSKIMRVAKSVTSKPIDFPIRGGQHNQWYQCSKCEAALKTLSASRHQCTVCGKIYSGFPYDDYVFAKVHNKNFSKMLYCAKAYVISGDDKFADFVKKILIGYAERYKKYPHHSNSTPAGSKKRSRAGAHIYEQTLNEAAVAASRIAPAYDMVCDSKVFSAQDKKFIKDNLILPMLRNIDNYKAGKSNWQSWHNAAMISFGVVFELPEWVDKGINSPKNGFRYQMKHLSAMTDYGMKAVWDIIIMRFPHLFTLLKRQKVRIVTCGILQS
jgi:hypothetical protein